MIPEEIQAQQAEIQAGLAQARPQQKSEGGISDVIDLALDVVEAVTSPGDILHLVAGGVRAAASDAADLAGGALDLAGSAASSAVNGAGAVLEGVVDGAGSVLSGAADVVGDAAGAVVGAIAEIFS